MGKIKNENRLTLSIPEAADRLGIGRNQAYLAAKTGQLPTIKIGKRILVPVSALDKFLMRAAEESMKAIVDA